MKFTTSIALLLLQQSASVLARPAATWSDWEAVKAHFTQRIKDSTCPDAGDEALKTHWDYDYERYRETMSEEEALNQDCTLFHRFRNPGPLGTRLIRHAFHDAAGGFNGFVNHHDLVENPGLHATMIVLRDDYNTLEVPAGPSEIGGTLPIKRIISFADFTAWAAHTALLRAVSLQNRTDRTGERQVEEEVGVQVRVGRPTYEPTSDDDHGPTEYFPTGLGAQGSGQLIVDYFDEEFGFTAEETVTIMGAHTLGGARREDSGFSGMWTQSKGKFNNDYQKQVVFPLPEICLGPGNCFYFSEAGDDILADVGLKQTCVDGEDSDRCHGWQQTMRNGMGDIPDKFQWQHSCKEDGTGCTHLMLNIDIGLFYDLEGYICTKDDEENNVPATAGRTCKEGMIKGYPPNSPCNQDDARVLATCFEPNEDTHSHLSFDADDMNEWVKEFGPLFDRLLTHKMLDGVEVDDLQTLTPEVSCANDRSWRYTTPILQNGRGGDERNCNFVGKSPEDRCPAAVSNTGVPATEACCACLEFMPNRSQGTFEVEPESTTSGNLHGSSTIFDSDFGAGFASSAGAVRHFAALSIATVGASLYLLL